MDVGAGEDGIRVGPGQAPVGGAGLEEGEGGGLGGDGGGELEAPVVVEEGEVMAGTRGDGLDGGHGDDAAPVAGGDEVGPVGAVILGEGGADGVETGEEDEAAFAGGVGDAVDGGCLAGSGPVGGDGEVGGPGTAAVGGTAEADGALSVAFGIDAEEGLAVLEEDGGGMAEVEAGLAIDDDVAMGFRGEIHEGQTGGAAVEGGAQEDALEDDDEQEGFHGDHAIECGRKRRKCQAGRSVGNGLGSGRGFLLLGRMGRGVCGRSRGLQRGANEGSRRGVILTVGRRRRGAVDGWIGWNPKTHRGTSEPACIDHRG